MSTGSFVFTRWTLVGYSHNASPSYLCNAADLLSGPTENIVQIEIWPGLSRAINTLTGYSIPWSAHPSAHFLILLTDGVTLAPRVSINWIVRSSIES